MSTMLNDAQLLRLKDKLKRYARQLGERLYRPVGDCENAALFETAERLYEIPRDADYAPLAPGQTWGGEERFGWFRATFTVSEALRGAELFLCPVLGGGETLLYVNGQEAGIFARKRESTAQGHHYAARVTADARPGETLTFDLESFTGRTTRGTQPFEQPRRPSYPYTYGGMRVCVRDTALYDAYFDLSTVLLLADDLPAGDYRRAELLEALRQVHGAVSYALTDGGEPADPDAFRQGAGQIPALLAPVLARRGGDSTPRVGLVGHSHMDTAWLWTLEDTIKKCARTYSNQLNLMERYPEHNFVQSSAYHGELLRLHYPRLFERLKARVAEGRYEPNGGVWVECDGNITGGEAMIRQFVWGQRFTREHFGYTSDCFWLPDTFGYSASIPQIMRGCGVKYFLTTKLSWNDTTRFPYDTFLWQGLDGTQVLAHMNGMTGELQPPRVREFVYGKEAHSSKSRSSTDRRLLAYGFGDGGGGPQFETLEFIRRMGDLDGVPKTAHTGVSAFMQTLEREAHNLPVYSRELYLELHRGTLTGQHEIKRNNRKGEVALHDLEALLVAAAVARGEPVAAAVAAAVRPLMNTLLVNQFHDVLPGTSIPAVNERSRREMTDMIAQAASLAARTLPGDGGEEAVTLFNTTSFARADGARLTLPADRWLEGGGIRQQRVTDLLGQTLTAAAAELPPLGGRCFPLTAREPAAAPSPFSYDGTTLVTPFARITFDDGGGIASFYDLAAERELREGAGLPLNSFLLAEEVSLAWDSWDIDADVQMKLAPTAALLSRTLAADGPVELRLRSEYRLTPKSTLVQDMIVYADSPRVDFDTLIRWRDDHCLLKTAFDTNVFASTARFEMQFGHVARPTGRSTPEEQAQFETAAHKFTDLSETRYGAAVLSDCKYGVSAEGGRIRLSLHKGGTRPDPEGDHGDHRCVYALLPHAGGFAADTVVREGYLLNYPCVQLPGCRAAETPGLAAVDAPNVVIETVKPCEDAGTERAFILRLYEAEGTRTRAKLAIPAATAVWEVDMLEEHPRPLPLEDGQVGRTLRPFEIVTLKVAY